MFCCAEAASLLLNPFLCCLEEHGTCDECITKEWKQTHLNGVSETTPLAGVKEGSISRGNDPFPVNPLTIMNIGRASVQETKFVARSIILTTLFFFAFFCHVQSPKPRLLASCPVFESLRI